MSYGPKPKKVAYVVLRGRIPGIYETWDECRQQVEGFEGACFRGYFTYEAAVEVWEKWEQNGINLIQSRTHTKVGRAKPKARIEAKDRMLELDRYARDLVRRYSRPEGSGEHYSTIA